MSSPCCSAKTANKPVQTSSNQFKPVQTSLTKQVPGAKSLLPLNILRFKARTSWNAWFTQAENFYYLPQDCTTFVWKSAGKPQCDRYEFRPSKGQIKPKADWRAIGSPKNGWKNLFCLHFCFSQQTNKNIRSFLGIGRIYGATILLSVLSFWPLHTNVLTNLSTG